MIDHETIHLALRTRLLSLAVAATGVTSLSATEVGFERETGSFLTDGFAKGMELKPSGFALNTDPAVITGATALRLTIGGGTLVEAAAAGRSLAVGLPRARAWENKRLKTVEGEPYIEEQYLPGPEAITNDGSEGLLELRPMYLVRVYAPANTGISADGRYADAIRRLFRPGTPITLTDDETLFVGADPAPFRSQRSTGVTPGWSSVPITIPCRVRTVSSVSI